MLNIEKLLFRIVVASVLAVWFCGCTVVDKEPDTVVTPPSNTTVVDPPDKVIVNPPAGSATTTTTG